MYNSSLEIKMAVWRTILKFEFSGPGVAAHGILLWLFGALNFKKARRTATTICSGLSQLTRSLSRIVYRGQEGPKAHFKA
jgi:hypothetical protein